MPPEDSAAHVALPAAEAAFTRLSRALEASGPVAAPGALDVGSAERARSLAVSLLAAVATGQPWDDTWFTDPRPGVSDDDLFAALLEAAANLLHLGAACARTDPLDFLRQAIDPDPDAPQQG